MKKTKFVSLFLCLLLFHCALFLLPQEKKIKVIAERANIHLEPDINSTIIESLKKGTILTLFQPGKLREIWYYVFFYSEKRSARVSGFIKASLVEVIQEKPKIIKEEKEEPAKKIKEVKFKSPKKIQVISDKTNIRLMPNSESQIIQQVRLGTIFQSEGKTGEWYWINLPPDEEGIIISGYIHQGFGEEVIDKVPEVSRIKKEIPKAPPIMPPKTPAPEKIKIGPKSGIGIIAGYAMPSEKKYESGLNYSANFYLGITKNIAIEISGQRFQSNVEENPEALSKGKLSITPIQPGLQFRFPISSKIVPYLAGGGGYYMNSFSLDDEIDNSWNNLGFDVEEKVENAAGFYFGTGIDLFFTKNLAFNADIRYNIAKTKGSWELTDQISNVNTPGALENLNLNSIILGAGLKFCF